jgi:hypothetical protein
VSPNTVAVDTQQIPVRDQSSSGSNGVYDAKIIGVPRKPPSPPVFLQISKHFTAPGISHPSPELKP